MHPLVLLATGYAALLLAAAAALEWLARHTAARSERYRTAGFTYRPDHDLWKELILVSVVLIDLHPGIPARAAIQRSVEEDIAVVLRIDR